MFCNKNKVCGVLFTAVAMCMQPSVASAQFVDPLIEGAKLCTRHLQRYETQYGIPAHLLSAIASTESGRYHEKLKIKLPWPWTINAEGKGYFYNSKSEAIAAAQGFISNGINSIDVGCMQVNIHHHPNAFSSISQAFEPENNVGYAASFLRNLYQSEGSWKKAASSYHSKTSYLGNRYIGLVYDSWVKILEKLRAARLNIPSSTVDGIREMQQAGDFSMPSPAPIKPASSSPISVSPKYIKVGSEESKSIAAYKTPQSKTINVSSALTSENDKSDYKRQKDNGVMVMRPKITIVDGANRIDESNRPPEPLVVANVNNVTDITTSKQKVIDVTPSVVSSPEPNAKIIRIDNKLVDRKATNSEITPIKASGPNFIFND